jgi:hypothetical protein
MGKLIGSNAEVGKIEEYVRKSYRTALARGEVVAAAARARLEEAMRWIEDARAADKQAAEAEANGWAVVVAEEAKANIDIAMVKDEMRNLLGRPAQNAYLDQVFPEGLATYTSSDPRLKPVLIQVLMARISKTPSPFFTEERKEGWVAALEKRRASYQAALDAHRPAEATATVTRFGYRGAVRSALAKLRNFKRDLKSLGLDEAAIHDIIPDASRPSESNAPTVGAGEPKAA